MDQKTIDRFWTKVNKNGDGCWAWTGALDPKGYGEFAYQGNQRRAHRLSWQFTHGPIPGGLCICHRCDNPSCVRPSHLFLGTRADNSKDMRQKGRAVTLPGERNPKAKLLDQQVLEIKRRYANGETNMSALGRAFEVSHSTVRRIVIGTGWTHLFKLKGE